MYPLVTFDKCIHPTEHKRLSKYRIFISITPERSPMPLRNLKWYLSDHLTTYVYFDQQIRIGTSATGIYFCTGIASKMLLYNVFTSVNESSIHFMTPFFHPIFLTVPPHLFLQVNFRVLVKFGNYPSEILARIVWSLSMYWKGKAASPSMLLLLFWFESTRKTAPQLASGSVLAKPDSTLLSGWSYSTGKFGLCHFSA